MEEIPNKRTYRNYFFIWSGQVVSLLGSFITQFAVSFWVAVEFDSSLLSLMLSFLSWVPIAILTFFSGVFIDRYNRRIILLCSYSLKGCLAVILFGLFFLDLVNLLSIIVILGIRSISFAFQAPTMMAITPSMIPKKSLGRVNGINHLALGIIQMASPFIVVLQLIFFPIKYLFWVEIVTTIIAVIPLIPIKIPKTHINFDKSRKTSYIKEFVAGFKVLIKIPGLLTIMLINILVLLLIQPLFSFNALFIIINHGGNTLMLGFLSQIIPYVSLIGPLVPIIKKNWKRKSLVIFISVVTMNIAYLLYALAPFRAIGIMTFGLIIIGFTIPIIEVFTIAIFQTVIPKDKIGRFSSIFLTISIVLTPLSLYLFEWLVQLFGLSILFMICAYIGICIAIITYFLTNIRHLNFDEVIEIN
ncbi:MAG: MFS transporter [Candidatus Thorarchaeota archaeon]